ncbi:MAG: hypothetical protein JNJ83_13345 [Verrucomicrobiaceae bacterium]|nr:hypothetical protein [Verrucomicrobiaceae bacterium]
MSNYLCHDFKSPRNDTSRRLPSSMRIVPIAFYTVLALAIASGVRDFVAIRKAGEEIIASNAKRDELLAKKTQLETEVANIETQRTKGESVAKWVEGTRIVQPLAVAIARAMPPETDVTNLVIERNSELPTQLTLSMDVLNGGMAEFSRMENALSRLNYRTHSPQQQKTGESVNYKSMIVYQSEQ